jgi:glyoxylase-like metal-dependent hydrolase (beta-lactamase superfamily II)
MSFPLTRRRFLTKSALTLGAITAAPMASLKSWSQQPGGALAALRASGATAQITTQRLKKDLYVLIGSGGNIIALKNRGELLLVDAGYATSQAQITKALAAISPKSPSVLINTHWHFDHTDGNEWLHGAGAKITAHRNTLLRLSTTQHIELLNATLPPSPGGAWPTEVFNEESIKKFGEVQLTLKHYAPAHTDTDISVHFSEIDVIHVGDTWYNGLYPFIDYSSGGTIGGMIAATQANLARASARTVLVPGHGAVGNREQMQRFFEMLTDVRERVATYKRQGKSVDEIVTLRPTAAFDPYFTTEMVPVKVFLALVYQGC